MRRLLFQIIIFILFSINLFAQNIDPFEETPLWLRLDNAIQKVESAESGEALYLFRKILEDVPGNPESEMWIGLILEKENEYDLAIKHLELAIEHKKQLVILEDQYRILYKLAEINYKQGDFDSFIENTSRIIEYSGEWISNKNLEKVMMEVLKNRGFDKFIELYRPSGKISLKAYSMLGKYYYDTGQWNLSINYLMYVTGSIIGNSIEEIKKYDPYFIFLINDSTDKSLENIFDLVKEYSVLNKYFLDNSFYELFFYLGKVLINSGYVEKGSYILEKIYLRPESGKWGYLANPR